jgi:hypothetical protein
MIRGTGSSALRMEAGCYPDDRGLSALVGELSVKNADFRRLWATHEVKEKQHGVPRLRHPLVGELSLHCESFRPAGDADQSLVTYYAEPTSSSAEALRLLASWGVDAARAGADSMFNSFSRPSWSILLTG